VKNKIIWISVGIVVLVIGFIGYVAATFKMPEMVGMDGIEIQALDEGDKGLNAAVKGRIFNGNFFSLSARKLDYLVTYNDTILGRGKYADVLTLASGDTTELELPMKLELQAIAAVHKSMLGQQKCALDIHLEGEFTSLHYAQGMDFTTEINPEEFIQDIIGHSMGNDAMHVEELTLKEANLKTSQFGFVSIVKNPLNLPLEIKALALTFYGQGDAVNPAGNWKTDKAIPLPPLYSTRVPGTVVIQHLAAGKGAVTTILTGEIRYDTKGTLTLQLADLVFEVPIAGTVVFDPVTRKGRWE
jgi:LEA14-like dessication related protein